MSTKRVLYKRETLYVGNWRENALLWLNNGLPKRYYTKSATRRIEQLIGALQTIGRLLPHFKTIERHRSVELAAGFTHVTLQMPSEALEAITLVEKRVRRYPSWPVFGWDPKKNICFGEDFGPMKRADQEEAEAALSLMRLAEVNELIWLRRCLCGVWFFARRRAQKSCSAKCRHKLYEQTERFKAKRRLYMKRYYRLQRSGKVR